MIAGVREAFRSTKGASEISCVAIATSQKRGGKSLVLKSPMQGLQPPKITRKKRANGGVVDANFLSPSASRRWRLGGGHQKIWLGGEKKEPRSLDTNWLKGEVVKPVGKARK